MKKLALTLAVIAGLGLLGSTFMVRAQNKPSAAYEYAIVKWDGPDRLYYNLPEKFELVYLSKQGITIPKEAQNEEYCLAFACNYMAKSGWEPVNLDSRRVVFRRPSVK
jgi:hypothetical protein